MNILVTVDKNWAIGNQGQLLVSIPEDQRLLREETQGGIIVMGCIMQIIDWPLALKWWALFLIMGVTLCLAIPNKLVDDQFKKSINKLPLLFVMMVVNLFRMKGMNKKFVNTEKNGSSTL